MDKILPYPMPTEAQLPVSPADWRPDSRRAALLIHDMQNYFLDFFPADEAPLTPLLENTQRLLTQARALQMPIFYSAQPGSMTPQQRGLLKSLWGAGMDATEAQRKITASLCPKTGEYMLTKWRYSAFFNSSLLSTLRELKRDQLIICGVYAHIGCLCTAVEAYSNDIETFFIADAVADFSLQKHHTALELAAETCSVVYSTRQVVAALK